MDRLKISILLWEDCVEGVLKHDEVVEEVCEALSEGGHRTSLIGVGDDLRARPMKKGSARSPIGEVTLVCLFGIDALADAPRCVS